MSRRGIILCAASGLLGATWKRCVSDSDQQLVEAAVERGVGWLLQQQAQDGVWHSETYGNMRGGAGNTALILAALSQTSCARRTDIQTPYERGIQFLTSNLNAKGLVQPPTGIPDYPDSATELLLRAISQRTVSVADEVFSRLLERQTLGNDWTSLFGDSIVEFSLSHRALLALRGTFYAML